VRISSVAFSHVLSITTFEVTIGVSLDFTQPTLDDLLRDVWTRLAILNVNLNVFSQQVSISAKNSS
jgi:hypothetical protein